jgi:hypothetical protein
MNWAEKCDEDLNNLCNESAGWDVYEGYERVWTPEGHSFRRAQMNRFFVPNRRDCWAYVQARAPIDVKQAIWEHEQDELIEDPRIGMSHVALIDYSQEVQPLPGVETACWAWLYIAAHSPWLEALAASHILERANDPTVLKGKTGSQVDAEELMKRMQTSRVEDLPVEARAHLTADTDHSNLVWGVMARYITDETAYNQVMQGARASRRIFHTLRQAISLAEMDLQRELASV